MTNIRVLLSNIEDYRYTIISSLKKLAQFVSITALLTVKTFLIKQRAVHLFVLHHSLNVRETSQGKLIIQHTASRIKFTLNYVNVAVH